MNRGSVPPAIMMIGLSCLAVGSTSVPDSSKIEVIVRGKCSCIAADRGQLPVGTQEAIPIVLPPGPHRLAENSLLRCEGEESSFTILFGPRTADTLHVGPSLNWHPLLRLAFPSKIAQSAVVQTHREALEQMGGRTRDSMRDGFKWPISSVPIPVSLASIRWNAPAESRSVRIIVSVEDAMEAKFSRTNAASSAQDSSEDLRGFLKGVRDRGFESFHIMGGVDGHSDWMVPDVPLMSAKDEESLMRELADFDSLSATERHVARGVYLWRRGMLAEAADELEAAVEEDSSDAQVVVAAAELRRSYGDRARLDALKRILPKGVDLR